MLPQYLGMPATVSAPPRPSLTGSSPHFTNKPIEGGAVVGRLGRNGGRRSRPQGSGGAAPCRGAALGGVRDARGEAAKRPFSQAPSGSLLQANVTALEKKGGRIVMTTCGGRLCIEASSNQGPNSPQWTGAGWKNHENGVQLVIPRGY